MSRIKRIAALLAVAVCIVAFHDVALAQGASPNDDARFLAGLQPSAGSPLAALTRNANWQRHAKWYDSNWDTLEKRQLSKVRAWSERHLQNRQDTLYYMFSGPDFLYADAFFPQASNYLLSGLEPVGAIPVVIEDDVLVGGNTGIYEGAVIKRRAVIGAGTILTGSTPIYDLPHGRIIKPDGDAPLVVPEGAVVVPGARAVTQGMGPQWGLSLSTPVIVKYRDEKTDARTNLEQWVR